MAVVYMEKTSLDYARKLKDPKFYLENFCKVKYKVGGVVKGLSNFTLNEAQKDLYNTLKSNNRILILKARQLGFSTGVCGYFYHDTITNPGRTTALIGYNTDVVSELLDKIKTFWKTTPESLRPIIQYNSKYEISFPKIGSKILILPSTENVGSGYTFDNVLLTELPKIDNAEEKMMSLQPAIPLNAKFVIESSPKGIGNLFHRMWMDDNNGFVKKKYGWWWGYTREEIEQIKKGCSLDFFAQEYDCKFLAGGRSVFGDEIINKVRGTVLTVGMVNDCIPGKNCFVKEDEGWIIYREPEAGEIYVVGADIAEGVRGGDYSVAVIFNRRTGEEVAFYRGQIAPDIFGEILNKMGRRYNNALMVPESNNHGIATIAVLKKLTYPSLYFRPSKVETLSLTYSDRVGWRTTGANRGWLIDDFIKVLRDDGIIVHSKIMADEISVFNYDDNGNMQPQSGFHDDTIFGAAIANQGFKILYTGALTQIDSSKYLPRNFSY